jgi:hypothetical protein
MTKPEMPEEIWTDINGNATRSEVKGWTQYLRADTCVHKPPAIEGLAEALQTIREALEEAESAHICSEACWSCNSRDYSAALKALDQLEAISGDPVTQKLTEAIEVTKQLVAENRRIIAERDEWKNKYLMKISEPVR